MLVFERKQTLAGNPGFHALLIGVSAYERRRPLSSAALSAYRLHAWLWKRRDRLGVPLATLRLMVAPSHVEHQAIPHFADVSVRCTLPALREELLAWREDATGNPGSMTFFYFAGHGKARDVTSGVLQLDDGEIDTEELVDLMGQRHPSDSVACFQLYFFDACRTAHDARAPLGMSLRAEQPGAPRDILRLFAAGSGQESHAIPGQRSVFSLELQRCLDGRAASRERNGAAQERTWVVTVESLGRCVSRAVPQHILPTAAALGRSDRQVPQVTTTLGSSTPPIHRPVELPRVLARIRRSPDMSGPLSLLFTDAEGETSHVVAGEWDEFVDVHLPAGLYAVQCEVGVDHRTAPTQVIEVAHGGLTLVVSPEGQIESF